MGLAQWLGERAECLPPRLVMSIGSVEPSCWKGRTNFHRLCSDLHMGVIACIHGCVPTIYINKEWVKLLNKQNLGNKSQDFWWAYRRNWEARSRFLVCGFFFFLFFFLKPIPWLQGDCSSRHLIVWADGNGTKRPLFLKCFLLLFLFK